MGFFSKLFGGGSDDTQTGSLPETPTEVCPAVEAKNAAAEVTTTTANGAMTCDAAVADGSEEVKMNG